MKTICILYDENIPIHYSNNEKAEIEYMKTLINTKKKLAMSICNRLNQSNNVNSIISSFNVYLHCMIFDINDNFIEQKKYMIVNDQILLNYNSSNKNHDLLATTQTNIVNQTDNPTKHKTLYDNKKNEKKNTKNDADIYLDEIVGKYLINCQENKTDNIDKHIIDKHIINDKKENVKLEENKLTDKQKEIIEIFKSDKMVYQKISYKIQNKRLTIHQIPIMFKYKYPIISFMEQHKYIDFDNNDKIENEQKTFQQLKTLVDNYGVSEDILIELIKEEYEEISLLFLDWMNDNPIQSEKEINNILNKSSAENLGSDYEMFVCNDIYRYNDN